MGKLSIEKETEDEYQIVNPASHEKSAFPMEFHRDATNMRDLQRKKKTKR